MFYLDGNMEQIEIGSYTVKNNTWGVSSAGDEPHHQTMTGDENLPLNLSWEWEWPLYVDGEPVYKIKGFSEIMWGWEPWWGTHSTTPHLPVKIGDMQDVIVTYDTVSADIKPPFNNFNTAFDLWTTNTDTPVLRGSSIVDEIMIWVNRTNYGELPIEGEIIVRGESFLYWRDVQVVNELSHNIFVFLKKTNAPAGTINLKHFIDVLVEDKIISADSYLTNVEFGNEVLCGISNTIINHYDIEYKKLDTQLKGIFTTETGIELGLTDNTKILLDKSSVLLDEVLHYGDFDISFRKYIDLKMRNSNRIEVTATKRQDGRVI